ncbi:MAG: AMP-binding protein [Deltaproteobacteria bacterium]|nr:AMP-binding protein [Deltaproteobacteria bacterium]
MLMGIDAAIKNLLQGPRFPDREFIRSGPTFGEVYAMAAGLRAAFNRPGYQGESVCLASDNKAVMAAALLSALAGGPPLLLPYSFSAQALARLRKLTGFTTAIADGAREFPEGVTVISPQQANPVGLATATPGLPGRELLKIFTGGSTGAPQVWAKTAENIFGEGFALSRYFKVTEKDRIVATMPPYHIYGLLFSVLLPLVSSATVMAGTPSFPGEIADVIREQGATLLASIPAHYRALRGRNLADCPLRLAFSSAGMLDAEDNEAFYRDNKVGIAEVYGSTETGGIATRNRFLGETHFTPFPLVSWKIKDDRICVASPFLSPGLPREEDGFFMGGDRVKPCGTNGFILMGRIDGVSKVGGKRVDLEEVRAIIKKEPSVRDCVVIALPVAGGRESRLAALIQGVAVDMDVIKKRLAVSLESYALPRLIRIVRSIPVKENGKYDRDAIRRLFES